MILNVVLALAVVPGVGVDWLHPQQGIVRQGVQGGGGGWGKRGRVGGEHGVVVFFKVHRSFWENTKKHVSQFYSLAIDPNYFLKTYLII